MFTDIFAKRYEGVLQFDLDAAEKIVHPTLIQAGRIFFEDVQKVVRFSDTFFDGISERLARELALEWLHQITDISRLDNPSERQKIERILTRPYIDNRVRDRPDYYCKTHLSLMEVLFRDAEARIREGYKRYKRFAWMTPFGKRYMDSFLGVMNKATEELKLRLQVNRTGLVYDNGFLHLATDALSSKRIAQPFWEIVTDPKWATVDHEMKEALDQLDHGQRDAHAHATMALESAIKIISNEKGWTRGTENGAAAYIDNLVSANNGRFIQVWEAEALKALFGKLRNPYSHGAGSDPPPRLLDAQQTWAIESCMSWIKSLVRRMP
jgi:hypothetical protein